MAYTSPSFGETSGGSGAVDSFNARTGAVLPQSGDYTASMVNATLTQQLSITELPAPDVIGGSGTYFNLTGSGEITIPDGNSARVLILKSMAGSSITLVAASGGTIDGQASYVMVSQESVILVADGSGDWQIN